MKIAKFLPAALLAVMLCAACDNSSAPKQTPTETKKVTAPAVNPYPAYDEDAEVSEADQPETPEIKLLSNGSILPSTGNLDLLFSSTGYAGARVRVRKIFTSNILQFLQFDSYETRYNLYKVARVVADTTVVLGSSDAPHIRQVRNYAISLDELINAEPGAIYHVEIRGTDPLVEEDYWDSDTYFGDYDTYDQRNTYLIASDVALIAKKGDNDINVFATDILSGAPLKGVKVKLYDSVLQEIGKGTTDADGCVSFPASEDGSYVLASSSKGSAYLALKYENSLSTSEFDVSGTSSDGGFKAYIFGERGVWRPGDTLHISAITMAEGADLPIGHPVTAELRNPDGQVTSTLTARNDGSHIYHFPFVTEPDAPTGRWSVVVKAGSRSFYKAVKIETVKPNKLDVKLTFDRSILVPTSGCVGTVDVKWLYGAVGSGLKVNGDIDITPARTVFKGYEDYDFKDDTRSFESLHRYYNDMRTDENGQTRIGTAMDLNRASIPGMLDAAFTMRAFEPSGEFSTGWSTWKLSPFDNYVGMKVAKDKSYWGEEYLKSGVSHKFEIATVGPDGTPSTVSDLHAEIFHVDWSWWWNSSSQIASYMSGKSKEVVFDRHISTIGGVGSFTYDWKDEPEGLYFVRVTDENGGHATSMLCEVYENFSSGRDGGSGAATRLSINVNKDKFKAGETARLTIPSAPGARVLLSLEKAGRIISSKWIDCKDSSTEVKIPITEDMQPNVYAFLTLVQPHKNTLNDAPVRMYGVQNINVEDASSHLEPVIDIPDDVKPETTVKFKVKEKSGKDMSYVIALVDEGLLGLTGFKTPNAWDAFYAKEALKVRTWDLYNDVIGAYGGRIEQLFAIGGDDEVATVVKPQNASRFNPVVAYLGPFTLKGGKTATHTYEVPQYIGALRTMVIATNGRAQGSAWKDVTVTKPVMVQATLPRALNVGEVIKVPVTLLTMKNGVGNVKLSLSTDDHFQIVGSESIQVNSDKEGQDVYEFLVKVGDKTGVGHITATAEAAGDKSLSSIEIDINNPNPEVTRSSTLLLTAGQSGSVSVDLFGTPGSNTAKLELSSIPAIDLDARLKYLLNYPYGCIEQTVSAAFPQLYLDKIMACDEATLTRSKKNVEAAIRRLQTFRLADGSMSYWPGSTSSSTFGSAYALHFLQEAEAQGYAVPVDLKKELIAWVNRMVSNSTVDVTARAYGVFALSAAGKPNRSAMNLMREQLKKLPNGAAWLLASAYAIDGKKNVCNQITAQLKYADGSYDCYGSLYRNLSVALKTCILTGDKEGAFKLASEIAGYLNDKGNYMSTQSTAWCLYSVSEYARANAGGINATADCGGKSFKADTPLSISQIVLPVTDGDKKVSAMVKNNSQGQLYAVVSATGIPAASEEKAISNKIKMTVSYLDDNGSPVNVDTLSRGRAVVVRVTVTNLTKSSIRDIALNHKFPSGWEIQNDRLYSSSAAYPAGVDYQDIRDDRVYSFFNLSGGGSVTINTRIIATYPGKFYLPAVSCGAMYDDTVEALVPGHWIEVK